MLKKFFLLLFSFSTICREWTNAQTFLLKENFEGASLPSGWVLYNSKSGSGSGYDWMVNNTAPIEGVRSLQYMYNTNPTIAADAWAFTPALTLSAGTTYYISFKQKVSTSSYAENLKVTVGSSATKAGQTITLLDLPGLNNTAITTRVAVFTPTVTQDYYFAFNCYSLPDKFKLSIDSINIYNYSCALPIITAQPVAQSECVGGNSSFTVGVSGSGILYKWQKDAIDIPGAQADNIYFNSLATSDGGNYNVVVTNTCGSVTSDIVNLAVKELPSISQISGQNNVCIGNTVQLNNATINGAWSIGNTNIAAISSTGKLTPVAAGSTDVKYIVAGANGCKDSVKMTVTVNPLPIISSIQNISSICVGDSVLLTNTTLGGTWHSSNVNITSVNSTSGRTVGISAGIASMIYAVTDNNGCTDSATALITVNVLPHAIISPINSMKFCDGDSIMLSDNTIGAITSYQWLNDTLINGATSASLVVKGAGYYRLVVIDNNGCTDTSDIDSVVVVPLPNPIIHRNALVLSTDNYASYQWYKDSYKIANATNQHYTVDKNGVYYVIVTDSNGCTKQSATDTIRDVSIPGMEINDKSFEIYPNPTSSIIYINANELMNITLYTVEGKIIIQKEQVAKLDIADLPNRVYIIKVTDNLNQVLKIQKITKID